MTPARRRRLGTIASSLVLASGALDVITAGARPFAVIMCAIGVVGLAESVGWRPRHRLIVHLALLLALAGSGAVSLAMQPFRWVTLVGTLAGVAGAVVEHVRARRQARAHAPEVNLT